MTRLLILTQAIKQKQKDGKEIYNQSQAQIVRNMLEQDPSLKITMLQYKNDYADRLSEEDDIEVKDGKIFAARNLEIKEIDPDQKKTDGAKIGFKEQVVREYGKDEEINFNGLEISLALSRSWGQALKAKEVNKAIHSQDVEFVNDLEAVAKSNSRCETARCFNESKVATPLTYIFDDKTKKEDREKYIKNIKKELIDGGGKVAFYIKKDYGIYGHAVKRVKSIDELNKNLDILNKDKTPFIIQKELSNYVPLRCSIANGKITGIFKGKSNPVLNENVGDGPENLEEFKKEHINFNEFEEAIIAAANSLYDEGKDKNFLGAVNCLVKVDEKGNIISNELEPIVLEVNDSPATSIHGPYKDNNVSKEYSRFAVQRQRVINDLHRGDKPSASTSPTSHKEVGSVSHEKNV
ncbi:hypothetical protein N9R48_02780 [Rickettsiales bacterium]|nr:hypothetical protein [Rickettsiales bacterium]